MNSILLTAITTAFLLITLVFIMDIHRTIKQLNHNMYRLNKKLIFLVTGTIPENDYPYHDEDTEDMKEENKSNNILNIDDYF